MNRVIIYARVSTEDQVEKYGLPAQWRACREFAAARDLGEVLEEISDEGISGATLERPGLDRVRQLVREKAVDVVLSLDPDRVSRDLRDLLDVKKEIERAGVRLEFAAVSFEQSPNGRLFFSMKGAIAEFEREQIRERTMRGKRERALLGKYNGGRVPFGYTLDPAAMLAPHPAYGDLVRQMYGWYDAGISIREIARLLRASGAPTWSGRPWRHPSVRQILYSETYAGVLRYGRAERFETVCPALVDRAQWSRVQERLKRNPHRGRPSSHYLLRGLLYCAECGRKMYGEAQREKARVRRYYRCRGRDTIYYPGAAPCRCKVRGDRLDAAVWAQLVAAITDRQRLRAELARQRERIEQSDPARPDALRLRARKLRAQEGQALSLMLDPDMAECRAEIKRRYQEAQRERAAVEREIAELERAAAAPESCEWIEAAVDLFEQELPLLEDAALRQAFVRDLVTRAEWSAEEGLMMRLFLAPKMVIAPRRYNHFPGLQLTLNVRLAA